MKRTLWGSAVIIAVIVVVALIVGRDDGGVEEATQPALSPQSLQNAVYQLDDIEAEWVELTAGKFEDAAAHVWVTLLDEIAYGDLTGDGYPEAVVVLAANTGGTGVFHTLAVVKDVDGRPVNVGNADLGDRVRLNALTVDYDAVYVDLVKHGPSDPMCCPTRRVTLVYSFDGEALKLAEQIPPDTETGE